jgi:hypothetical protein
MNTNNQTSNISKELLYNLLFTGRITMQEYLALTR